MSPRSLTRLIAPTAIAVALVTAAGCAALPGAEGPAPTSTASASPTPSPTPTSTTPAPEATPVVPSAVPSAPATGEEFGAFTRTELAQICIDATASTFAEDVRFDLAGTRVEHRTVTPEWLVIVPAQTGGLSGRSLCTIGGSPAAPVLELSAGSISELPEEQIQRLIRGENEGGDR